MTLKPDQHRRDTRAPAHTLARSLAALVLALTVLALAGAGAPTHPSFAAAETTATAGDTTSSVESTCTQPPAETPTATAFPIAGRVSAPRHGAYTGVFLPPAPVDPKPLSAYNSSIGKPAAMVMWFQAWSAKGANRFDTALAVSVWKRGAVPVIAWEPWSPGDKPHDLKHPADMPEWKLSLIAKGRYDAYLTTYARDVRTAGGPVMISLFHEMNGCWYPWGGTVNGNSPADFIAAWRHVHDIFAREGATNVTWVWSVNFQSRPDTKSNRYSAYYPGDAYVDWVGVSGFNWGQGVGGGPWRSFETIYNRPLRYLKTRHKPVMITEMASVENGGDKAHWLTDAYRRVRNAHAEVKAVVYYNAKERSHKHVQDWRVTSSKRSLRAYRCALASRSYVGTQNPALANWRAQLLTEQWNALLSIRRIYTR